MPRQPTAKIASPNNRTGLRPKRSESGPHSNCAKAKPARNTLRLALMAAAGVCKSSCIAAKAGRYISVARKPSTLKPPSQTKNPFPGVTMVFPIVYAGEAAAECRECNTACETLIFGGCIQKICRQKMWSEYSLEVVDAVARNGSFSGAAQELHRVPSAISYTVRQLEEWLAVPLFERRHRDVEL